MSKLRKTRLAVAAACACGGLLVSAGAAQAAPVASASATAGTVDVTAGEQTVREGPIAECRLGVQDTANSPGVEAGTTKFGKTESQCSRAADTGFATSMVRGQRFETKVLRKYGGPVIKVRSFSARCDTTTNGASGLVELSDVTGIEVPPSVPANHTVLIPGDEGKTVAKVVLNEIVVPEPPDGSLTTRAMRIELFPEGGPAEGEIVVGAASCAPYGED
ncbi:choice-of-anchor P family protein [Amycolatopsis sp. YIM 10]|uniref:choice-of-anchor P family protein n=1 Tax=Amycolatopsis sp. YIM 10 TaxID=2653857 RepID=UPI0012AA9024|nr:choice-of-anchor P family protein [Amycolatopsis sp. YIM 10]QFU93479.1 hypothetical protein YIM_41710 [Amycolatopsis sp. YIM 10]